MLRLQALQTFRRPKNMPHFCPPSTEIRRMSLYTGTSLSRPAASPGLAGLSTLLLAAVLACAAVVPAACTTPASNSHAADLAAIADFNQRYLRAINEGDIAALGALTDEDHIMIAPNRPPIEGREANNTANGRGFQQFSIQETWTPLETVIDTRLAYQRGVFTVVATPKSGGTPSTTHGNFLRIYRRQPDGSWRMTRDMFSSDQPAPGR
jgi:ketosteroid isomerase-like protein